MIVADTDVLIDFLRDVEPIAARVQSLIESGGLATTVITAAELFQGAQSKKQREAIAVLLDGLTVLDFNRLAAERAGSLRRDLISTGQDIGLADCAIAAICLIGAHTLLTGNQRHFARITDLRLATDL